MQGEVRGLPLFYSYVRLMRKEQREGWKRGSERGETGNMCVAAGEERE